MCFDLRASAWCGLPQSSHQHWPAQHDFEKMPGGGDLFRRAVEWGVASRLYQNNLVIKSDFEARFRAIAGVEGISQTQNSGKLQGDATLRKVQKLQALLARPGQGSPMITGDERGQLQLTRVPAQGRSKVADHPK